MLIEKIQFGGTPNIGCSDGLFTIKNILNMKKNHNTPTFLGFVNLVKAFDNADHELFIKVLERYKSPSNLCSDIYIVYQYFIVVLKIVNSVEEIVQEVVVRQWDNMEPVLFLFLMASFSQSIESIWK